MSYVKEKPLKTPLEDEPYEVDIESNSEGGLSKEHQQGWRELMDAGLLWFINRNLHIFGYAIVVTETSAGEILSVEPERIAYRGFKRDLDIENFEKISKYMVHNSKDLLVDLDD